MKEKDTQKIIVTNRQARRDYFVLDAIEAGMVLSGCEVKSLRGAEASLEGSFARLDGQEVFLYNSYIAPYEMGGRESPPPLRIRKLLLHRSQIEKLKVKTLEKGLTLVPLKLYFNQKGIAKVEVAVVKAKKFYDKRADMKKESAQRDIDRAKKQRNRG